MPSENNNGHVLGIHCYVHDEIWLASSSLPFTACLLGLCHDTWIGRQSET